MKIRMITGLLFFGISSLFSQDYLDIIKPFQGMAGRSGAESGISPAARGAGNALLGNPALLSYSEKAFISADLSFDQVEGTSVFNSTIWDQSQDTGLSFNSLTYIHPIRVYRGAWVLGVSLQPVSSFSSINEFSDLEPDEGFDYQYRTVETGNLYAYTLGTSVLVTMNTSLGLAVSYLSGENTFTRIYKESDTYDVFTFDRYIDSLHFAPQYSGVGARLGLLTELSENISLGASLEFPSWVSVSESSSRAKTEWLDTGAEVLIEDSSWPALDYSVWGPWRLGLGLGFSVKPLEASVNYRFHSYRTSSLSSDLLDPDTGGSLDAAVADQVDENIQNVHEFSASLHWTMDPLQLSFAASIMNDALNYQLDNIVRMDLGFGYQLSSGLGFTLALRNEQWQSNLNHELDSGVERSVGVDNNFSKLQFGLKYIL